MGQEPAAAPEGQTPEAAPAPTTEVKPEGETKVFDEAYVKQLRQEAAQHRTRAQEAETKLTEREEAEKSDLEKAQGKLTKLEQEAADAKSKLLRYEVAQEKNVPANLVPLLTASKKEDLEAQADLILENAKPVEAPNFDGGAREPAPDPLTPEQEHNKTLLGMLTGQNT